MKAIGRLQGDPAHESTIAVLRRILVKQQKSALDLDANSTANS